MFRLNKKAYKILAEEIKRAATKDSIAGEVAQKIAFKRLERLHSTKGSLVTEAELKELFKDILPDFSDRTIKKAVKANQPPSKLWLLPKVAVGITALSGIIWVLNLPYPMIRRPVARTAPILLLPSFISMDRNYRAAIAKVEQADRLVNDATSMADLERGKEKLTEAQYHLNKLPVWFIGYEPTVYMNFFRVGFLFTLDEFKAARADVGRMEAITFQETNAMNKLNKAEVAIKQAKQDYQQAKDETTKQNVLTTWQNGIDRLVELHPDTLAAKMAQTKLKAYYRDFEAVSGLIVGNDITNKLMKVAQLYANRASTNCFNTPLTTGELQQCIELWQKAISPLEKVPIEEPSYLKAQNLLIDYETELSRIELLFQREANSVKAYESAQYKIERLPTQIDKYNKQSAIQQIRAIMFDLQQVESGTTVDIDANRLLTSANKKLRQIEKE